MAKYTRGTTRRKTADKPSKPYKDFPLTPHASGSWQKKILGRIHYFGRWGRIRNGRMERLPDDGWKEALKLYKERVDGIHSGITPKQDAESLLVKDICNAFLRSKLLLVESGEITARTFSEYRATTDRLVEFFGKNKPIDAITQGDFESLRASIVRGGWGPVRLGNEVVRIRSVFKYSKKLDLVPDEFRKPSKKVMRKHRTKQGKRLFTADEIRQLLAGASLQLRAMTLLAINCGFGNSDVGELRKSNVYLDTAWIDFPRPKTGVERRCPLWPETVAALRAAAMECPKANDKADRDCFFVTVHGHKWVRTRTSVVEIDEREITKYVQIDAVGLEFGKLLRRLGFDGRKGLGLYSLRHTFATIGLQTGDRDAVKALMGHAEGDMLSAYDETGPSDDRLRAVVDHVHSWLFPPKGKKG